MSHHDSPAPEPGHLSRDAKTPAVTAASAGGVFREAFESAPEALLIADADTGSVVAANASWRALFAGAPVLPGRRLADLPPWRERADLLAACTALPPGGTVREQLVNWTGADRRKRSCELNAVAFRTASGRALRLAARDVSAREDETARRHVADKIEALRLLAGSAAHDFNNVLSCVRGYISVALETRGLGAELQDILTRIRDASVRASALPQRLLEFSRQRKLTLAPVELRAFVRALATELRPSLPPDIALDLQLEDTPQLVSAQESALKQVVQSLVQNAREAITGAGVITLSLARWNPPNTPTGIAPAFVRLAVQDSGRGMPAAVQARLFEPGFTTKKTGGAGMGLALAYRSASQHGGWIEASSEEGRGSTFTLVLPLAAETAAT